MIARRKGSTKGIWHLHRRVPTRYQKVAGKTQVWVSLHTDSETEARSKAGIVWNEMLAAWDAKIFGQTEDATRRLEAARQLAGARGVRFMQAQDVARLPARDRGPGADDRRHRGRP